MELPAALVNQGQELGRLWRKRRVTIVLLLLVAAVLGGAQYGYDRYASWQAQRHRQEMKAAARGAAASVAQALGPRLRVLARAARQPALAKLLEGGDSAAIAREERRLAKEIAGTLRVRLLGPDVSSVDYSSNPPLDYAGLELIREAAASSKAPPLEAHLFGTKEQHLAFVRRIDGASGRPDGYFLAALDVRLLKEVMRSVPSRGGYTELRQVVVNEPALILGHSGDASAHTGAPALLTRVPGTRWQVAYWPPGGAASAGRGDMTRWLAAGIAFVVLGAGLALAAVRRRNLTSVASSEAAANEARAVPVSAVTAPEEHPEEPAEKPAPEPVVEPAEMAARPPREEPAEAASEMDTDEVPASIFRAYDIRGVVGETLSAEIVHAIGQAIGSEAAAREQQTVVVGRDGRLSGPALHAALVEGLRAAGRDVIDIGRVPTPVLYFATYYLNTGSGVMVTGSHNPPEYNGLKIMLAEETLFGEDIAKLRTRIEAGELVSGSGSVQSMDLVPDYVRQVSEDVPVALGTAYKIVVDCGNGVAGDVAPKLLRALGHDVVELYCEVDGYFPNHHPDPSQPENLRALIDAVQEHKADLGFAFDGDGDRLGIVDGRGNIIWPDRQMMLFARDVLKRNPGAQIVYDVKCTSRLGKVIRKLGGEPVMWKTGHSFIKNKMRESGALLAGEMSGHIFFKDRWYGFDDALYSAARMLEILLALKQPPSAIFAKLPAGVSTPELRVDLAEGRHLEFMHELTAENRFADAKVTTIDGIRVDYPDGWGLVRASNTTPSLVLRFEGDDEAALQRIEETFRAVLLGLDRTLELPF